MLTLWRWSIAVQVTSVAMITLFFGVLQRSVRREDLGIWATGWLLNLLALSVALFFWLALPDGVGYWSVRFCFLSLKTLAALVLLQGGWALAYPGRRLLGRLLFVLGGLVYPLVFAFILTNNDRIGVIQQGGYGVLFVVAGLFLWRSREQGLTWLASGFLARGLICVAEGCAYAIALAPSEVFLGRIRVWGASFLSASSSFDSATEWLLALGFVLALSNRLQRELQRSNQELLGVQEDLRQLADRDPLTGLPNRRSLPEIFRSVRSQNSQVLFFDLDDFKRINDVFGHQAGDACLKRFSTALRDHFRSSDAFVRYAGDEFLVVAPGISADDAAARISGLRVWLDNSGAADGDAIRFSVGVAELLPGGDPEQVVRDADKAMYGAKALSSTRPRAER
jgi:diguanylate cyclase (GGDEF)-like protein